MFGGLLVLLRLKPLILLVGIFLALPAIAETTGLSQYKLNSGDVIQIMVYGESELSLQAQLSDAGTLSYPFLGEINLLGLTAGELQRKITKGLKGDYLINPEVTVTILQYRNFYLNGEVRQPGGFPFEPGLTVRKAISLAGGFTERAAKKNIFVIPDGAPNQEPKRVTLSTSVKPGDIITVEQSFF